MNAQASKMGKSSKKGRISGTARKELNTRRAQDAVNGLTEGITFGRVVKMVGNGHVIVGIQGKHGMKELNVRIPNVLSRKGATPITTRDVVTIYVGTDFDPESVRSIDKFDLTSVLTIKQAYSLSVDGLIPSWMIADIESVDKTKLGGDAETGGFEFDYNEGASDEEDGDADAEVDVDAI